VALLTTAAAMQATAPAQAALAVSALATAKTLPAPAWISWLSLMTTQSAIKATAAVALAVTLPVLWQVHENTGLRAEVARLEEAQLALSPLPHPPSAESSSTMAAGVSLASAEARLISLRAERSAEDKRFASLQSQASRLTHEVVVSLGHVDEIAAKVAEMQKLILELEGLKGQGDKEQAMVQQIMDRLGEVMPLMAEFRRISSDPKLGARMAATTTARLAGVSDAVRDEMERRLLRHYQQMKINGLTLDRRPKDNRSDWDRRFGEASAAAMRDIESFIPADIRATSMWQSQISPQAEAHLNLLEAIFGTDAPRPNHPPTPANKFLVDP
jgi:hypothetical protein